MTTGSLNTKRVGLTVWLTGLSGSGKTTICEAAQKKLSANGITVHILDGDELRKHLCLDLGFTREDRNENVRRIAQVARLLTQNGSIVLVSAISPYRDARDQARRLIESFAEVHVNAPLEVCELRDTKGLYKQARLGEIRHFTGIDAPYECPANPEIVCNTGSEDVQTSSAKVVQFIDDFIAHNPVKS